MSRFKSHLLCVFPLHVLSRPSHLCKAVVKPARFANCQKGILARGNKISKLRTRTWKFESLYRPPRNHFASRCGLFWWVSTGTSTCVQMQEFLTLRNMKAELPKLMKSQYFQNVGDELPFFDSYSFISSKAFFARA